MSPPHAFVHAADLGIDLSLATPPTLNGDETLLAGLEGVRAACAVHLGVAASMQEATERLPVVPRLTLVQAPETAVDAPEQAADRRALGVSMGRCITRCR